MDVYSKMQKVENVEIVREKIRAAIDEKKSFKALRADVPDVRKRQLLSLIFDVMEQLDIKQNPFCRYPLIKWFYN